jgi:hypothetical protein
MKNQANLVAQFVLVLVCTFSLTAQNYNSKTTLTDVKSSDKFTPNQKSSIENVIIVYKTHFDIGYSETVQQVLHDYRTSMCDKVLEAIDKNRFQPKDN